MRILQIAPVPPEVGGQTRGGVASHAWELAVHLAERGHKVAVLADNCRAPVLHPECKFPIDIYGVPGVFRAMQTSWFLKAGFWEKLIVAKRHFGPLGGWGYIARSLSAYHRVIGAFKPDVIHVHHLERRFPFAFFASDGRIPIVTTVHSPAAVEFGDSRFAALMSKLIQRNLGLSENLIFVSDLAKKRFEKILKISLENHKTWTLLNPLDSKLYYPLEKEKARTYLSMKSDRPVILFVANIHRWKGVNVLIDAIAILKNKGRQLNVIVIGEGPQKEEIRKRIENNNLTSCVSLMGKVPLLLHYYNAADLFVLPSLYESFGLVYVEAMLCGCPVVGTQGIPEEVIPSVEYGYRIPINDPNALAETIEVCLSRNWNREKIVQFARSFDWSKKITGFENMYTSLVSKEER